MKLHKLRPTIASDPTHCTRYVDSTNPARGNQFRSGHPILEAEKLKRLSVAAKVPDTTRCLSVQAKSSQTFRNSRML